MKKLFIISIAMLIGVFAFAQNKTTSPVCEQNTTKSAKATWAEVENYFNVTDINGNNHDLAAYLDAGKTVIIDFSCAWCSPCWSVHQSGVFEELYNAYGPSGTDELVILWVEIESTNTAAQITGTSSGTAANHDTYSQGDWTEGGTWPIPIIDSHLPLQQFTELYEGYVPTIFMVCPSGFYKDITAECWNGSATVYAEVGTCPAAGEVPVAEISGPSNTFIGNSASFENTGISVDPITGYAWTFEGGTPATSTDANPSVIWDATGEFNVTLIVSNANGNSLEDTHTVTVIDPGNADDKMVTFEEVIVESTFPTVFAPYNWITEDVDGGTVWNNFSEFGVTGSNNAFSVYSHTLADSDYAPYAGDKCGFAMTNNGSNNNDWFISPLINLGTASSFSVYVRSTNASWGLEEYKLSISTTTNDPASFTVLGSQGNAPASWTQVVRDLSAYDGQSVYLAVNYVGTDNFAFMIDNLEITTTPTGTNNLSLEQTRVFPNPASDVLNINYANGASVRIFNNIGQEVFTLENANEYNQIDLSSFEAGSYVVTVIKNNRAENHKLVLVK